MKKIIIVVLLLFILLFLYTRYVELYQINVNEYTIENSNIPVSFDGIKIVQFSDTLISEVYTLEHFEKIVNEINSLDADIVIFSGDLIDDNYKLSDSDKTKLIKLLSSIKSTQFNFAIVGDNDQKIITDYSDIMKHSEFILLDNKSYPLFYKDNSPIVLTGLTDTSNLTESYKIDDTIDSTYSITLMHKPDDASKIIDYTDLVLGAHSLGGYINLPFIGPVLEKDGATKYINGYYNLNDTPIYVSNGLGTENTHLRFNNSPSINLYRLKVS